MPTLIDRLKILENDVLYVQPATKNEPEFAYTPGVLPVLFSAPHGAAHTRDGHLKEEDEYTAGLARLVGELAGAHVLYARRLSATDPNRDNAAPYKQALTQIVQQRGIRFVVDLHGAHSDREFGIAVGTIGGTSCSRQLPVVLQSFRASGFQENASGLDRLVIDHDGYKARGSGTVTRYVMEKLKVPAAQFELNAHLRVVERRLPQSTYKQPFSGDTERIERAIWAFTNLAIALNRVGTV